MDRKNVNQRGTSLNQAPRLEEDGVARAGRTSRENVAVIFFRRVGRAFAELGGVISRAFSNLGESFRGAFAHVSNAIRGVDSGPALRNVTVARSEYSTRFIDLDKDEDSEETDLVLDNSASLEQNLTSEESKKESDFSEYISPTVIRKPIELPEVMSQTTNTLPDPATPEIPLAGNISSLVDSEISPAEKLFDEFSERYQASEGYASISSTDQALLDPSCLAVARRYQESHPEHADISYSDDVQKKRKAATALLNADTANRARDAEKDRLAQEAKDKAAELTRRKALPAGQADFEDFVTAYNKMEKPYPFVEKSRFLAADCIRYAEQRLLQSPPDNESAAIKALLKTAGVVSQEQAKTPLENDINTSSDQVISPPPPPPSTPRWMSTLSSILKSASKSRDEMPEVFATMLMPHHGTEDRNLAWQGLYLLSSPPKNNLSSAVTSGNEATLSYQHNSVQANTDDLRRLELADRLIGFLQTLKIDEALKAVHVTRPSDEQIHAIRSLQKDASQIMEELGSRIKALLPAKKTTSGLISKIPTIDSLNPSAFISASEDFNSFVKEFSSLSEQQNIQYQFVGGRAKYSRPNCAAIAQTVIASYKGLDPKDMIKEDRDRLSAAEFMISEFNKKNTST